jgi:hypothetical protein
MIAQSNYGGAITLDQHRWYVVIREDDTVLAVIGQTMDGPAIYDSVEEWEEGNT